MALLKNTGKSPRGVHDVYGRCVVVEPGEIKQIKISDDQATVLNRIGTLLVIEDAPVTKDVIFNSAQEPEDLDQLRKDAEDLGIKVDRRWGSERLQTEIDNALRSTDSSPVQD